MNGNLEPLPLLLLGVEQRMMASPRYRRAVREYEKANADRAGARAKRLQKISRAMARDDRKQCKTRAE